MLNELYDLAQSLKMAGVLVPSWHRHFKPCPKGTATFFVLLDSSGQVTNIEPVTDRERIGSIRKWEVAPGVSFPAFNVLPLFEPVDAETKTAAVELRKVITSKTPLNTDEIKQRLKSLVEASASLWLNKESARITNCLTTLAGKIGDMLGVPPDDFRSISELISRSGTLTAENLQTQLAAKLAEKIVGAPHLAADLFDSLFFHSGKKAKAKQFALIFDLSDRSKFQYPAVNQRVQSWMNQQFQANVVAEPTSKGSQQNSVAPMLADAYAESPERLKDKFPSVTLPILGPVILRSMHKASQCQVRYRMVESLSCPVGHASRQNMKDGLEWLGSPDRKDRTWADARGLCGYTRRDGKKVPVAGLLFAYPSRIPEVIPEIAGLIMGLESNTDPDGSRFEACAARVTGALGLKTDESSDTQICVFALKKADKARTKLLQSRTISAFHLVESVKTWQDASRNIPLIAIRQKTDKPFWTDPFIPYPAEVVSCLDTAWERVGTHAEQISGFGISDGLGLLLERGTVLHAIAMRAIRTIIPNSLSLVLALGRAHHQGKVHPMDKKYSKQALLLPSIFGLLLAKIGRLKGEYMKGPPFLIGRLLSLTDQLHIEYCLDERKGQIASQLLGSGLMPTALEQPEKAMALLSQRLPPYKNWASRLQSGDRVGLIKYFLGEMGRLCNQLKECVIPQTADDTDKAEMLLGYLASSEKDSTTQNTNPNTGETSK